MITVERNSKYLPLLPSCIILALMIWFPLLSPTMGPLQNTDEQMNSSQSCRGYKYQMTDSQIIVATSYHRIFGTGSKYFWPLTDLSVAQLTGRLWTRRTWCASTCWPGCCRSSWRSACSWWPTCPWLTWSTIWVRCWSFREGRAGGPYCKFIAECVTWRRKEWKTCY